jgi:molybdopterin-binding protein
VEDDGAFDLVSIDVGNHATILSRVAKAATRELALAPGKSVWALVKAISVRGITSAGFRDE